MSYSLLLTPIAIISLLWYWYILANFCNILGTLSVQTCLFETWGNIVTQYIAVVVHHCSLRQETDRKMVLCNARSVSEIVNIWWWEEQSYTFTFIWECWLQFHDFLSIFIWVLVIYNWFKKICQTPIVVDFQTHSKHDSGVIGVDIVS